MEPQQDVGEARQDPGVDAAEDRLEDYQVAGIGSKHPSLIMFLYSSPIIGCFLLFAVPFVAIALAGTRSNSALVIGLVIAYLVLVGSIVAPFLVLKQKGRSK